MQYKEIGGPLQATAYVPGQACAYVPSQATAGTDDNWPVWQAPAGCTVTGAVFVPSAAVTADPSKAKPLAQFDARLDKRDAELNRGQGTLRP